MKFEDLMSTIVNSDPERWNQISDGPLYKDQFISSTSAKGNELMTDAHTNVAVYKDDLDISIAWGLDAHDSWFDKEKTVLTFDLNKRFADQKVHTIIVDVFWRGSLVEREYVLAVDGYRAYLPLPTGKKVAGDGAESATYKDVFNASEIPFARFMHNLVHHVGMTFDEYMSQAGLEIVDN